MAILESTGHALAWTDRVFEVRPEFLPGDAEREFTLVVSDAQLPIFGRALTEIVAAEAPRAKVRFEHSTARLIGPTMEWLPTVDAIVLPQGLLSDVPSLDLYSDRWVCVISNEADATDSLTRSDLTDRPWVMPYHPRMPVFSALHHLRESGVEPRAEVSTEDFLAIPYLIAGTDRIGLMPERVARLAAQSGAIRIAEPPFELGVIVEALWWHPIHERDPAHRWLRRTAMRAAEEVASRDQ